eukprot:scaffold200982_cov32-Tisochrysis_lutea.AAC.1
MPSDAKTQKVTASPCSSLKKSKEPVVICAHSTRRCMEVACVATKLDAGDPDKVSLLENVGRRGQRVVRVYVPFPQRKQLATPHTLLSELRVGRHVGGPDTLNQDLAHHALPALYRCAAVAVDVIPELALWVVFGDCENIAEAALVLVDLLRSDRNPRGFRVRGRLRVEEMRHDLHTMKVQVGDVEQVLRFPTGHVLIQPILSCHLLRAVYRLTKVGVVRGRLDIRRFAALVVLCAHRPVAELAVLGLIESPCPVDDVVHEPHAHRLPRDKLQARSHRPRGAIPALAEVALDPRKCAGEGQSVPLKVDRAPARDV